MRVVTDLARSAMRQRWTLRGRLGTIGGPDVRVGLVVLSLRRPANIEPLVRNAGRCRFVSAIVVSNNDVSSRAADFVSWRDPQLRLIDEPELKPVGIRWDLARSLADECDVVLSIDDDVFLLPGQIRALVRAVLDDPRSLHGVAGQIGDRYVKDSDIEVDYVVRAYALAPPLLDRYDQLRALMPVHGPGIDRNGEDIVMSIAEPGPPRIHDVGRVLSCKSSQEPGVALSLGDPEFDAVRASILAEARAGRASMPD